MADRSPHAFPNITPDMNVDGGPGMSLRDYFAGQALIGILAEGDGFITDENIAKGAYKLADAMLIEREKEQSS